MQYTFTFRKSFFSLFLMAILTLLTSQSAVFGQLTSKYTYSYVGTNANVYNTATMTTLQASGTVGNDAVFTSQAIGFTFKFNCVDYTTIGISSNGFIWFGSGSCATTQYTPLSSTTGETGSVDGVVAAWANNLAPHATGTNRTLTTKLTGTAPNQVFIIEWRKAIISGGSAGHPMDAQIRLFEGSNNIEIRLWNSPYALSGNASAQVGIRTTTTDFMNRSTASANLCTTNAGGANTATCSSVSTTACGYAASASAQAITYRYAFSGSCCTTPATHPSASTASPIGVSSATLSWTPGSGTGGDVVFLKEASSVATDPVNGTSYTGNASFGSGTQLGATGAYAVYNGTGGSVNITNLLPSTTYYYKIVTYDATGSCYKNTSTATGNFTTSSCSFPATQATAAAAQCPTASTMTFKFDRGNGSKAIVLAKAGSNVDANPAYNTSYTASSTFGAGTQIGTGNYVVYNGSDAGTVYLQLSGLAAGTTYYFKVFEYNESPNCYNLTAAPTASATTLGSAYVSSATTQNTANVAPGALAADIIRLNVVVQGDNPAARLKQIVFTSTGSTNTGTDVTNARIFYTGSSSTFSATTQFGATFTTFGTMTATGDFALLAGNNYFWVAYDVQSGATPANVLDATITNFTITDANGTNVYSPTPTAPAGSRPIASSPGLTYCSGVTPTATCSGTGCNFSCSQGEQLSSITISGATALTAISWPCNSTCGNDLNSYTDRFSQNRYQLSQGGTYNMSISFSYWFSVYYRWAIWIDWNQDGVFTNGSPERFPTTGALDDWTSQNIVVPASVSQGRHRARLWIQEFSYEPTTPCRTSKGPLTTSLGYIVDFDIEVPDGSLPDLDPWPVAGGTSCATALPVVSTPVNYTVGDAAAQLSATGTSLLWYTTPTGGVGSATAPTPSTASAGTQTYYVSSTSGCESPRTQVAVNVTDVTLTAPTAAATDPTCATDGSVELTGLPAAGWTIVPGYITGTGTSYTISPVAAGTYSYQYITVDGCFSPLSNSVTIGSTPSGTQGYWIGVVSTDWFDPDNWCAPIPDATTDVFIPSSAPNMPEIATLIAECRDLNIASGGSLNIVSGQLDLYGNIVNDGTYTHTGGRLVVTGSAAQSFGGATPGLTVENMTMNNAAGLTLSSGILTVNDNLTMTAGLITTGSSEVRIVGDGGSEITSHSAASYINGRLRRNLLATGNYDYPVGNAANYELLILSTNGLVGVNSVLTYFTGSAPQAMTGTITELGKTYDRVLTDGYWTITPNAAPSGGDFGVEVVPVGFATANVSLGHSLGKATTSSNDWGWWSSNRITDYARSGYTGFSDIGIVEEVAPLPIELTTFTGHMEQGIVQLDWATASEQNNAYFTIDRTQDRQSFEKVADVSTKAPGGNSASRLYYSTQDLKPLTGTTYYRLRQTDLNGSSSYHSEMVTIINDQGQGILSFYPNPASTELFFDYQLATDAPIRIAVLDMLGKEIMATEQTLDSHNRTLRLDIAPLAAGVYQLQIIGSGIKYTARFVKKSER